MPSLLIKRGHEFLGNAMHRGPEKGGERLFLLGLNGTLLYWRPDLRKPTQLELLAARADARRRTL